MRASEIKTALSIPYKNSTLLGAFDNAAQSAVFNFSRYHARAAKKLDELISKNPEFDRRKPKEPMQSLFDFHSKLATATQLLKLPADRNFNKDTLRHVYSLIYHLLPEGCEERQIIDLAFSELGIKQHLTEAGVIKSLPKTLSSMRGRA